MLRIRKPFLHWTARRCSCSSRDSMRIWNLASCVRRADLFFPPRPLPDSVPRCVGFIPQLDVLLSGTVIAIDSSYQKDSVFGNSSYASSSDSSPGSFRSNRYAPGACHSFTFGRLDGTTTAPGTDGAAKRCCLTGFSSADSSSSCFISTSCSSFTLASGDVAAKLASDKPGETFDITGCSCCCPPAPWLDCCRREIIFVPPATTVVIIGPFCWGSTFLISLPTVTVCWAGWVAVPCAAVCALICTGFVNTGTVVPTVMGALTIVGPVATTPL
uniref:Uncharacterized protein n=1 Tax=Anopheles coluzzii TaxID=1518534 RepID=A0A8W7PTS3_ANOCL